MITRTIRQSEFNHCEGHKKCRALLLVVHHSPPRAWVRATYPTWTEKEVNMWPNYVKHLICGTLHNDTHMLLDHPEIKRGMHYAHIMALESAYIAGQYGLKVVPTL